MYAKKIEHVREGKHGARSAKQVIAIGLARRVAVKLPPPPGKKPLQATGRKPNPTRSRVAHQALEGEGTAAASHEALSRQAHQQRATAGGAQIGAGPPRRRCARRERRAGTMPR